MNGGSVDDEKDGHENDLVMPGFRFHPTEEELIDFYLRRKVEGKHFNVELITFLDLYRYDPWELPALATIGEKEWFFYVPRDRKYRNGDRPNRVTTSGYWKATGADRIIRSESSTPIGLKKTLVYYYGKAPKGIRSSWIMNEYRLPQSENNLNQKAEISICRVYKRGGTEDHLRYMRSCKPASLKGSRDDGKNKTSHLQLSSLRTPAGDHHEKIQEVISGRITSNKMSAMVPVVPLISSATFAEDTTSSIQQSDALFSTPNPSSTSSAVATARADELIGNQHEYLNQHGYLNQLNHLLSMLSQPQILPLNGLPNPLTAVSDGLWESNPLQEAGD